MELKSGLCKWLPMNFLIHAGLSMKTKNSGEKGKETENIMLTYAKSFIEMWKFSTSQQEFLF